MTQRRQNFMGGAVILAGAVAVTKLLGALYKIPLGNLLDSEGMAHFYAAYNIYSLLLVLSTAVLTERGANGGCGSCFACRDLQLNVTGDLLCHERHLLNIECGNDRRFRPPLARLNVSPTFAAYAAHRF